MADSPTPKTPKGVHASPGLRKRQSTITRYDLYSPEPSEQRESSYSGAPLTTPAFVTGSRKYGRPRDDSDIDLVVLVETESEMRRLFDLWFSVEQGADPPSEIPKDNMSVSLRFGSLNLIVTHSYHVYQSWAKGTKELYKQRPVSRVQAIEVLEPLRQQAIEIEDTMKLLA